MSKNRRTLAQSFTRVALGSVGALLVAASALGQMTSFEAAPSTDFRQASNANFSGNPSGAFTGDVIWIGSILQQNNSLYVEHMSVPQRVYVGNFPSTRNDQHTLTFRHQAAKGSRHAYDYLTSWDQAESVAAQTAASMTPPHDHDLLETMFANECGEVIGPQLSTNLCDLLHAGFTATVDVPDDMDSIGGPVGGPMDMDLVNPRIAAYELAEGNRTIRLYGNGTTGFSNVSLVFNGYSGNPDDYRADYTLSWTSDATDVMVELAGHLSPGSTGGPGYAYDTGYGAAAINGGPYHFSLEELDGASLGNQDNQIKAGDLLPFEQPPGEFCYGIDCPCGNNDSGAGCQNSSGAGGHLGIGGGTTSVAADDLVLTLTQAPANQTAMLIMGLEQTDHVLGDGRFCVSGGPLKFFRYKAMNTGAGGTASWTGLVAYARAHFYFHGVGVPILAGDTWNFQVWFRDPGGPCGTNSNTSNGLTIDFVP